MKNAPRRIAPALFLTAALALPGILTTAARAQAVSARATSEPAPKAGEEVVELSPFEVTASSDDSYDVLNSNSLTSFSAELGKLPISADVFTQAFIDDTNSSTLENMLRDYSAGAGTGSVAGDVDGSNVLLPMDRSGGEGVSTGVMLRGLGAAVLKQDNFMLPSPIGTGMNKLFGIERVEIINGPQALLYGNGGGGGVMNTISKQARFARRANGSVKYQIDSNGHFSSTVDYGIGNRHMAIAVSAIAQELGDHRLWVGGQLEGVYMQIAARLGRHTVLRFTGKYTYFDRIVANSLVLDLGGLDKDTRHGQTLRYLLTTNQVAAPSDPTAPAGAGVILNGHLNWENLDSFCGDAVSEQTLATMASAIIETKWSKWLSTQVAVGYQNRDSQFYNGRQATLYSPASNNNPTRTNPDGGDWVIRIANSSNRFGWASQPARSTSVRASALLTNDLFRGKAHSQTSVGVDYTQAQFANVQYTYFQSDEKGNIRRNSAGTRMRADNPYWSVDNGPVQTPFPDIPRDTHFFRDTHTAAQVAPYYYAILDTQNMEDPALVTPDNPRGIIGTSGLYLHSRTYNRGAYAVNFTQWGKDRRLTSLLGMRYMSVFNRQWPSRPARALEAEGKTWSFSAGLNYELNRWLKAYVVASDTYNLPDMALNTMADPYGRALPVSHSIGEEVGLKIGDESNRISGSISFYELNARDEPYAMRGEVRALINPEGVNGRYGDPVGNYIAVDKKSYGTQVTIVATPIRGWKMRLSAALIKGTIGSNTSYATLYNDKFHVNDVGQLTYGANGPVVYVNGSTFSSTPGVEGQAGFVPLTVEMLSTPGNRYYADPHPDNGRIQQEGIINLLQYQGGPGSIITGEPGRPMSEYQLTGVRPVARIVTSVNGERTTGYPELSFSFVNSYTFPTGPLKGFKVGCTIGASFKRADMYYYENGVYEGAPRKLFSRDPEYRFNLIFGYSRKFSKITWITQINIDNVFDKQEMLIRPNGIWGYNETTSAGAAVRLQAFETMQPRTITWTNTLKF